MLDHMQPETFTTIVLEWFRQYGRSDLPWQQNRDPYAVWVSEIMLQQTQVNTVIPYFEGFMQSFPNLRALADAPLDSVLHHWSGLGYYARARNLHKAAKIIRDQHGGHLPEQIETLKSLPGIGRSTAGAVLSLAMGQPHPILDGNVKRVLARYFAIEGWPGRTDVLKQLWALSDQLTPCNETAAYNQAMMDLGALVCKRGMPDCENCPLNLSCQAHVAGREQELPTVKPKKKLPVRAGYLLVLQGQVDEVLLTRRPPVGIWGGLWSFPECPPDREPADWCKEELGCEPRSILRMTARRHTFTHFHFDITPVKILVNNPSNRVLDSGDWVWYKLASPDMRGLAAPVSRILNELRDRSIGESK